MSKRVSKLVIDNASLIEEFFEDTLLWSIVSPEPLYHVAWEINKKSTFNFFRNPSADFNLNKQLFASYTDFIEEKNMAHYLFQNKVDGHYLLSDLKNVDFFWMQQGSLYKKEQSELISILLKKMKSVQAVLSVNPLLLKDKHHLMM
ncbi:MAG: IPExxxVDY family protein [Chitinophagaceae bacterium]